MKLAKASFALAMGKLVLLAIYFPLPDNSTAFYTIVAAFFLGIAAVVIGAIALGKDKKAHNGYAWAGIVIGILPFIPRWL